MLLAGGDGGVEDGGDARGPGEPEAGRAVGERPAEAEVRPLAVSSPERHDVQKPRRAGAELAELVEHERREAAALGADAVLVLGALGRLNALDGGGCPVGPPRQ